MAGASALLYNGNRVAYCPYIQTWAEKNNLTVNIYDGQPGDLALFEFNGVNGADHIGIIERKNSDGSYTTIEGNTSSGNDSNGGSVMRRIRWTRQICCIVRPQYETKNQELINVNVRVLRYTAKGNDVKALQILLNGNGCNCGLCDGSFGPKTLSALKTFQSNKKLQSDGICGPLTWSKLLGA